MPKINKYVDISQVEREAKRDLIDRHSPLIKSLITVYSSSMLRLRYLLQLDSVITLQNDTNSRQYY